MFVIGMAKVLKFIGRLFGGTLEWLLICLIVFAFIIRSPKVQTYLGKKAATYLSEELGAEVKIDRIAIIFFDRVALDGLMIKDLQGDTLIAANRIIVHLDNINLKKSEYTISTVIAKSASIHLQRSKDRVFNYAFIRDYFVKDEKSKKKVKFLLEYAEIQNSRFQYDDHGKEARKTGMDYFHLDARKLNGIITNLNYDKDTITAQVQGLSAIEKCGFQLNCLSTAAKISPAGVELTGLEILSKESWIRSSKFNMLSDSYNCFLYFVDSVRFDAQIDESNLSLKEVAYFAYALEGMDDQIRFSTKIKRKVTQLKLPDFDLDYKKNTHIHGNFQLDDYRRIQDGAGFLHERIDEVYIDLEEIKQLRLPNSSSKHYLSFSKEIERLKFIEGDHIFMDGNYKEFVFAASTFRTALGWAQLNNGIKFKAHESHPSYIFTQPDDMGMNSKYDFTVHNFELGTYLGNNSVGGIDGSFHVSGEIFSASDIRFSTIEGEINEFEYLDYPYSNIVINEGSFQNNVFKGNITVKDENLDLAYNGFIDFNGTQRMDFTLDIHSSDLSRLNLSEQYSKFASNITVKLTGKNLDTYAGGVEFKGFEYTVEDPETQLDRTFSMEDFKLGIKRYADSSEFTISGNAGQARISGRINLSNLSDNFNYQFSRIFPALYKDVKSNYTEHQQDHFTYSANLANPNSFLKLFYPKLDVAPETTISGFYNGADSRFQMNINSSEISYSSMTFKGVDLKQELYGDQITATYQVKTFQYSDSLSFENINFNTHGGDNHLFHRMSWEEGTPEASILSWETNVFDLNHYGFTLNPSHFFISDRRWDISQSSSMTFYNDTIEVQHLELTRNEQRIFVNGLISNNDDNKLNFEINHLELEELSPFITSDYPMTGLINAHGYVANPFNSLNYVGNGTLTEFFVKNQKVGDISVYSNWDAEKQSIFAKGDLSYADEKTFDFSGDYYLFKEKENLDFKLNFDYTNLQFTNAFLDPDVVSDIYGLLYGQLSLTGSPENPILDGTVDLTAGSAKVELLGVHFGVEGPIVVDQYGFYINGIPVYDEEGNSGMLVGSVFHDNYKNFNFDLQFDLEPAYIAATTPIFGGQSSDKFLVMNLPYDYDVIYYGKGYVNGTANIFGYSDNLEITVDFKTARGTTVNIPMYGVGEINEDAWLDFKKELDTTLAIETSAIDLSGVQLDLNFNITPDANINIIFDKEIGDVISAKGSGDIAISLNNQGDIRMEGTYVVKSGAYNFAMKAVNNSPFAVKQTFTIEEGGSISWLGDPYDAKLDLRTYYKLNANLAEISGDELVYSGGAHQLVLPYLSLSGSIEEPQIQFEIKAPNADDIGRTLINRINSDPDELSRQFFSLMIARRFQPIGGSASGNGSAALDLLTNQINSMLSRISEEYILKVGIDNDAVSGDNTYEFGVSRGFLDNRLIFSGSFGVESYGKQATDANGNTSTGQLIGDINLEYLLNPSGTFRVNIFNESSNKTIIQQGGQGNFTQGAGLSYKEDFEDMSDFKLVQYVLDIFRKKGKKRYPNKGNRQQRPLPENDIIAPKDDLDI